MSSVWTNGEQATDWRATSTPLATLPFVFSKNTRPFFFLFCCSFVNYFCVAPYFSPSLVLGRGTNFRPLIRVVAPLLLRKPEWAATKTKERRKNTHTHTLARGLIRAATHSWRTYSPIRCWSCLITGTGEAFLPSSARCSGCCFSIVLSLSLSLFAL